MSQSKPTDTVPAPQVLKTDAPAKPRNMKGIRAKEKRRMQRRSPRG